MNIRRAMEIFKGPKSVCRCNHLGDGFLSDHEDTPLLRGHGKCKICDCDMFSWKKFSPAFEELANQIEREANENNMEDNR